MARADRKTSSGSARPTGQKASFSPGHNAPKRPCHQQIRSKFPVQGLNPGASPDLPLAVTVSALPTGAFTFTPSRAEPLAIRAIRAIRAIGRSGLCDSGV